MLSQNTQFGLIWPQEMLKVTPFFGFFDDSEHNLCGENKNIAAFCAAPAFFRPDGLHSNKGLDTFNRRSQGGLKKSFGDQITDLAQN